MPLITQIVGIIVISIGIIIELVTRASMGYVLITGGSLAFAIGTKFKHRRKGG